MEKYAVVIFNLGGPDSLEAVEPFLRRLFTDPDIFKFPFMKEQFARFISRMRAPKVRRQYAQIGGFSPINEWTEKQRQMLEKKLQQTYSGTEVIIGMRYWRPSIELAANKCDSSDFDRIFLLPLYPQYSLSTTGSAFNEWNRHYTGEDSKLQYIKYYYDNPKYISAINQRIDEALDRFSLEVRDGVVLLFSAHGIPLSYIEKGDPYNEQIIKTVGLVMKERSGTNEHQICYQSKVGPVKWLEPSVRQMLEKLAAQGKRSILVVPISFVSDHIETLFEINIYYRSIAMELGIENFEMTKGLNDSQLFTEALKEEVIDTINNNHHK